MKQMQHTLQVYLMQYRWRCVFRDAYHVCCILWPFAHVKLDKIQQVIEHYSTIGKENIVNFDQYKHERLKK